MVSEPRTHAATDDDLEATQELPVLDLEAYESDLESPAAVGAADSGEVTLIQPPPGIDFAAPANLSAVEADVAALGSDVERLRDLLAGRDGELLAARDQIAAALQRASDAEAARAAAEASLAAYSAEVEVAREERAKLLQRLESLEAELLSARSVGEELAAVVERHAAAVAAANERATAAERAAAWANADSRSLRAQVAALQEVLRSREMRRGVWESIWRDADAALAAWSHASGELSGRLQQAESRISATQAELAAARAEADALRAAVEQARAASDAAADRAQRADEEAALLRSRLVEAESHVRRLEIELSAKAARIEALHAMESARSAERAEPGDASGSASVGRREPELLPEGAPRFLILSEGQSETVFRLGRRTTIGRAEDNDISLGRSSISRHHAVILAGPRQTVIEDLDSTNGVLVNRRRVRQAVLRDGDVVQIGKCKFRFSHRLRGAAEAS